MVSNASSFRKFCAACGFRFRIRPGSLQHLPVHGLEKMVVREVRSTDTLSCLDGSKVSAFCAAESACDSRAGLGRSKPWKKPTTQRNSCLRLPSCRSITTSCWSTTARFDVACQVVRFLTCHSCAAGIAALPRNRYLGRFLDCGSRRSKSPAKTHAEAFGNTTIVPTTTAASRADYSTSNEAFMLFPSFSRFVFTFSGQMHGGNDAKM